MQEFESKRNALFACLDDASKELKGTSLDQSNSLDKFASGSSALKRTSAGSEYTNEMVYRHGGTRNPYTVRDKRLTKMRGKESIFKKPELPISKCLRPRRTPDYQINPQNWTKYSLADVDISDHTNTAAAFDFLRQIDEQRDERGQNVDGVVEGGNVDNDGKIEFKKSSKIKRYLKIVESAEVLDAEVDKPKMRGSRLLMPEYVVGQKKETKRMKAKQRDKATRAVGSALSLSHLIKDDDDDDDDVD